MASELRRFAVRSVVGLALSGSLIALAAPGANPQLEAGSSAKPSARPRMPAPPLSSERGGGAGRLNGLDPLSYREQDGRLVADLDGGATAVLTFEPALQRHLEHELSRYQVPYGAVVAIEPSSGKLLCYVSHSTANPDAGDLVRDPTPPAASVFKIVTAAALLDSGVSRAQRTCYHGGFSGLSSEHLVDDPRKDRACATLDEAIGASINSVFAKLADHHLEPATLERYAQAFGFGHALPFDVATRPSPAEVPEERLEFARTAAGFWHTHMSPLHGALIAATVANDGRMPRAIMVERVLGREGKVVRQAEPEVFRHVIGRATARALSAMMTRTVTHGTARKSFHDLRGRPFLPGISVAGKTGSLSVDNPYRAYSWWVGHAPENDPQIAVAALVVNTPKWRIKGSYVAREALRKYLELKKQRAKRAGKAESADQSPRQ